MKLSLNLPVELCFTVKWKQNSKSFLPNFLVFSQIHLINIFVIYHQDILIWLINQAETALVSRSNDWEPDCLFLILRACSFYHRLLNEYMLWYYYCWSKLIKTAFLAYSTGLNGDLSKSPCLGSSHTAKTSLSIPWKGIAEFFVWKQLCTLLPVKAYIKSSHKATLTLASILW